MGAMGSHEFTGVSAEMAQQQYIQLRNECLVDTFCWVSLGNSAGVKINEVPGSRGGSGVEAGVGSSSLPSDHMFVSGAPG